MAAILNVWRHIIRNATPSVDAYLAENIPAKFHFDPIWNDGGLRFFEEVAPDKKNNKNEQDE